MADEECDIVLFVDEGGSLLFVGVGVEKLAELIEASGRSFDVVMGTLAGRVELAKALQKLSSSKIIAKNKRLAKVVYKPTLRKILPDVSQYSASTLGEFADAAVGEVVCDWSKLQLPYVQAGLGVKLDKAVREFLVGGALRRAGAEVQQEYAAVLAKESIVGPKGRGRFHDPINLGSVLRSAQKPKQ